MYKKRKPLRYSNTNSSFLRPLLSFILRFTQNSQIEALKLAFNVETCLVKEVGSVVLGGLVAKSVYVNDIPK